MQNILHSNILKMNWKFWKVQYLFSSFSYAELKLFLRICSACFTLRKTTSWNSQFSPFGKFLLALLKLIMHDIFSPLWSHHSATLMIRAACMGKELQQGQLVITSGMCIHKWTLWGENSHGAFRKKTRSSDAIASELQANWRKGPRSFVILVTFLETKNV